MRLAGEKIRQASKLVSSSGLDAWLIFDRETVDGGDPVLPLILEGGLTWQSALVFGRDEQRLAVVGNYDADPLKASGDWDAVFPYVQSIRPALLSALDRLVPPNVEKPRIGVNFSTNDPKADGLSHGMFLLLEEYLAGTRFEGSLVSAESLAMSLRGCKTSGEIARMRAAILETDRLFTGLAGFAGLGRSEREIFDHVHERIAERGLGYAWDEANDPIVNSGPDSMVGHGIPSPTIRVSPGHILHVDLGVSVEGYCSDLQRCWYVPHPGETGVPEDAARAAAAVNAAITAGAAALRPGARGWEVDAAARGALVAGGYPEYLHAFGHQVGRVAHDGGAVLGPRWERYGTTPEIPVECDQVYTVELGTMVEGRGYLGLEEMVLVTVEGVEWLSERQRELPVLDLDPE